MKTRSRTALSSSRWRNEPLNTLIKTGAMNLTLHLPQYVIISIDFSILILTLANFLSVVQS